jgi:prepilin-type N-terminal cleavage/methylation domain-containing protein
MIKKIRSSKAFTLIEMLIVVAIIGILVGVGVPALRNARADAQLQKRNSIIANVATAKARYELDNDTQAIATYNAAADSVDTANGKFDLLQEYLVVNGTTPANVAALIKGSGYEQGAPGTFVFGNMSVYNSSNGTLDTAPVSPSFTGTLD